MHVGYLFIADWTHEFHSVRGGLVPSHRLFGALELAERGHIVSTPTRGPARWGSLNATARRLPWKLRQAFWVLVRQGSLDVLVATHEGAALHALVLRRLGLLRTPLVVVTVAAASVAGGGWRNRLKRWALRGADALTVFATAQRTVLAGVLGVPLERVHLVPWGVDTDFFGPVSREVRRGPITAVGTNDGKDYPTLIAALRPHHGPCTIITDAANQSLARAAGAGPEVAFRHDVPIVELREVYRDARVIVLPLRETDVSSGQTVLLENLALGSPVIVSDVAGVRDYVGNGLVHLVPPGDAAALREALDEPHAGSASDARRWVESHFTIRHTAATLEAIMGAVTAREGRTADPRQ